MTLDKMKVGLLIGFIGLVFAILALFVPASIIFFALLVGLLFVIPILAIASIVVIGASIILKKLPKSKKEALVISTWLFSGFLHVGKGVLLIDMDFWPCLLWAHFPSEHAQLPKEKECISSLLPPHPQPLTWQHTSFEIRILPAGKRPSWFRHKACLDFPLDTICVKDAEWNSDID